MTKKKDVTAADDLIKSLLNEVNSQEDDSSPGADSHSKSEDTQFPPHATPPKPDKPVTPILKRADDATEPLGKPLDPTTQPIGRTSSRSVRTDDKTHPLHSPHTSEYDYRKLQQAANQEKVMVAPNMGGVEATLAQAENLRIAQTRILELEKEVDRLRLENEEVASAAEIVKSRLENLTVQHRELEQDYKDSVENAENESTILRGQLEYKESELAKAQQKIEDLEIRLKNDFRKVRVRERELENRLELVKAEKTALIRSKDESILELKRKIDQLEHEIDNYREKCLELNKTVEAHKDQFKRTVRALKLALTNLEVKEEEVVPLKKAE